MSTRQKTSEFFKSTGRGMWRSGSGFAKVGALYSGVECCIEGFRAKNDLTNAVSAGFISGAVLARNSGPRAAFGGGMAFAAFSAAIDMFMRRETADED
ncbi:Mitochondrial import inner membrane translocase subunit tim22 [Rhizoctonia solani]